MSIVDLRRGAETLLALVALFIWSMGTSAHADEPSDAAETNSPSDEHALPPAVTYFENRARPWTTIPSVTIASAPDDQRIPLVLAAIEHWNSELAAIGTAFRIGEVGYSPTPLTASDLIERGTATADGQRPPPLSAEIRGLPGDLIVALSDAAFVSFSLAPGINERVLVGISGYQPPRTFPNVMANVITHELGHAIGLGHNDDPSLLMCGRPAPCRPDAFRSLEPRIFSITDEERATLLRFYPPDWQPSR
jgi:hypothetical protein